MTADRSRTYVIRIDSHLDDHWSSMFDGLTIVRESDGTTTLTCLVTDQAQLHGVLTRLRDIGAALLHIRTASPTGRSLDERPAREPTSGTSAHPPADGRRCVGGDGADLIFRPRPFRALAVWSTDGTTQSP